MPAASGPGGTEVVAEGQGPVDGADEGRRGARTLPEPLADEQQLSSPLTLLLCPSQLTKAVKESGGRIDKRAIVGIAKKLG